MPPTALRSFTLTVLCMLMGLAVGCSDSQPPAAANPGQLRVVASIPPLASLVQQLLGEHAHVQTLLTPGANPHGFDPTPTQVATVAQADWLVMVGLNLDPWAAQLAKAAGKPKLHQVTVAQLLQLPADDQNHDHHEPSDDHAHHHDDDGRANPHVWMDPVAMRDFVSRLSQQLIQEHPQWAVTIERNTAALLDDLQQLDAFCREQLTQVQRRQLVTFHNSLDPLTRRYGLDVVAHLTEIELQPGGEVTPRDLANAIGQIRQHKLPVVYAEPQFPDGAARSIQSDLGVQVLMIDVQGFGGKQGYQSYQQMIRSNVRTLVEGQSLPPVE